MRLIACLSVSVFYLFACGKSEDTKNSDAAATGSLRLNFKSIQSENSSAGLTQTSGAPFKNYSIASGKPDEFNIDLVRIVLNANEGPSRPIFSDDAGKKLAIKKSRIDLSETFTNFECVDNNGLVFDAANWYNEVFPTISNNNEQGQPNEYRQWSSVEDASCECGFDKDNYPLGTNSNGECPPMASDSAKGGQVANLSVEENTYQSVTIYYKRRAQIKGCVTGYFFETWGSNATVEPSTFCTQSSLAFYDKTGGGTYTNFEDKTAELMDFDLAGPQGSRESSFPGTGSDLDPNEIVRIEFPIPGGITIDAESTAQLTLVIDTNRMLRFFSNYHSGVTNNGSARGPGPDTVADKSYFYTTVFKSSQFFFVGRPGNIYGYEMITLPCSRRTAAEIAGFSSPADFACTNPNEVELSAWLTVIEDPDGKVFSGKIVPDDDNAYVALNGDNLNYTLDANGAVAYEWGKNWTANSDGTFNLNYRMGTLDLATGKFEPSLDAVLHNIDPKAAIGAAIPNVYFVGSNSEGKMHGTVAMKRQL